MDEAINNNYAEISGTLVQGPCLSHESRGEQFFKAAVAVQRLSGTDDILNVLIREKLLHGLTLKEREHLHIFGQLRSFNNKSGEGAKLVVSLFARDIIAEACEERNDILLRGTICKPPTLRKTPLGREISDFMLAINRKYGRSDYIPCIAWGQNARAIAAKPVGTTLTVSGRFQSRQYIKTEDGVPVQKTAYEVSVIDFE
ncbi:MAG: single-stranded DNA-binding protein [Oscillospiraceae bacterium]|nr:single-stranded DNA-binding protein [Oscillospiraceae bacterium]